MSAKIITSFLTCLACLLFAFEAQAQQGLNAGGLAGTYVTGHRFGGRSITLKEDGTYSEGSGSCTSTTEESGKYRFSDGVLRFTILKYTGKQNDDDAEEVDLFDPQARKEFFGYGDEEKVEPLTTEYSLLPVKWGERIYLIYEHDLQDFSNAINLGLEPRPSLSSEPYYGSFFLREGDEQKGVSGKPSLPAEWQSFLLGEPVRGEIVAIEEQGEDKIGIINRGRQDGLKVGMKLISKDEEPTPWSKEGIVLAVEETTAKVQIFDLKVGDTVSTRYVPKDIHR